MASHGMYEVPADATDDEGIRQLTDGEIRALRAPPTTLEELFLVASLLDKIPRFPGDVISTVLQYAGYCLTMAAETSTLVRGYGDMNHVFLTLQLPRVEELALPPGITVSDRPHELTVECTSRDQGWASFDSEHNGTYRHSHTWSEVAVMAHGDGSLSPSDALVEVARKPICANVRATRQERHHVKHFHDPAGILQHIHAGCTIQLFLRSQYPGWSNSASYGRLEVRFFADFDDDVVFYPWGKLNRLLESPRTTDPAAMEGPSRCSIA